MGAPGFAHAGGDQRVEALPFLDHQPAIVWLGRRATVCPHLLAQRGVGDQLGQPLGQRRAVVGREEESVVAMADQLRKGAGIRSHHGQSDGEGLQPRHTL